MKTCSACKEAKAYGAFVRSTAHRDGYHGVCKPCRNLQRNARGRTETKEQIRKWRLKSVFGITPEHFAAMLASQGGICAICGATPDKSYKNTLYIDHCHTKGNIRGLLCSMCNLAIGLMMDDPTRLNSAAKYLEAHNK